MLALPLREKTLFNMELQALKVDGGARPAEIGSSLPSQEAGACARRCVLLKVASYLACCRCICCKKPQRPPAPRVRRKVLVIGPAGAGKTALLERMSIRDGAERLGAELRQHSGGQGGERCAPYAPTAGLAMAEVALLDGFSLEMCELGGAVKDYWHRYKDGVSAVVFVVDGSAPGDEGAEALADAGATLEAFAREHCRPHWPVLVLANDPRAGAGEARDAKAVEEALKMERAPFHMAVRCCTAAPASSHAEQGLVPALDWLGEKLA